MLTWRRLFICATVGPDWICGGEPGFVGLLDFRAEAGAVCVVMVAERGRSKSEDPEAAVEGGSVRLRGEDGEGERPREGVQGLQLPTVEVLERCPPFGVPIKGDGEPVIGVLWAWGVCRLVFCKAPPTLTR